MVKKVLIDNIEFRLIVTKGYRSHDIISYLLKLSGNNAKTISEIYTELNIGKKTSRYAIGRHHVSRTISILKKYEPEKIRSKEIKGKTHYWITSNNSTPVHLPPKAPKNKDKELLAEINQEKILEKDLYPEVKEWLNNYKLDGIDFRYMIHGGAFLDKSKFSNPDIIGINIQGNHALVVSVEVKNKIDNESELVGFAQCCSYKLFSDYVFFFCYKPNSDARAARLMKMCQYFGIGLKFLDSDKLIVPADRNESKIGDTDLKHLIIEKLKTKDI